MVKNFCKLPMVSFFLFMVNVFIISGQEVNDLFVAGKWKIEEVVIPDNKFNDKREKKLFSELAKTVLHFKGDGHFSFIYGGEEQEVIRNIKQLENSRWSTIEGENAILLEKEAPLVIMPVEIGEKIIINFFKPIRFQVSKIEDEQVNFLPKPIMAQENPEIEKKIDSVFKFVEVDKKSLKDSVISEYPILEGCEEKEGSSCFNKTIRNRIIDALDLKKYNALADLQRVKLFVSFAIDTDGLVKNIEANSPDETLSYDLKLIINNLDIITPAKDENGQPMLSSYTIPLTLMM
ncbi:hypothetical protein [Aquimarina sp. SS2-1]|uniref:hypothetical protein n=1 Tax=Aquimarina besae TaxID=3342247 RepID=UPI00366EDAB9